MSLCNANITDAQVIPRGPFDKPSEDGMKTGDLMTLHRFGYLVFNVVPFDVNQVSEFCHAKPECQEHHFTISYLQKSLLPFSHVLCCAGPVMRKLHGTRWVCPLCLVYAYLPCSLLLHDLTRCSYIIHKPRFVISSRTHLSRCNDSNQQIV